MKQLKAVKKYFWKYRLRLSIGIMFIFLSNYFNVLMPQVTRFVIDFVQQKLPGYKAPAKIAKYDYLVQKFADSIKDVQATINVVALCGIVILILALLRGV